MKRSWARALLLGLMFCVPVSAEVVMDVPEGKNPSMFEYTVHEEGEKTLNGETSYKDFTADEISSLQQAGGIWDSIIQNTAQTTSGKIIVYSIEDQNAYAYSPYVEYYESPNKLADYKITALNAAINGKDYIKSEAIQAIYDETGKYYDAFIGVGVGLSSEIPGWDTTTEITALYQGTLPPLTIVMEHELAHGLGIFSGSFLATDLYSYFSASKSDQLTIYDKYIRVYDSLQGKVVTAQKGMPIITDSSYSAKDMELAQKDVFDMSKDAPYFAGPSTMKVLSGTTDSEVSGLAEDAIIAYCENKIKNAGGLVNYTLFYKDAGVTDGYLRVNGLPVNASELQVVYLYGILPLIVYAPELSHIELRNSYMSHQNYRNWITFMEAELAVLKDIGYDINLDDYFGQSFYLDNTVASVVNDYALNKNQAVGVHVYGENSDILQISSIQTTGTGAFGVRIDGVNNKYTLNTGTIDAKGTNSIGLGVTYGSGHEVNIKSGSTVRASGKNSSAVSFDFGKNMLGEYIEDRGSYIHTIQGENQALNELEGALVENFNIDGTIEATGDAANAIYISPNAYVKNINIQKNAKINGAIVSRWNSEKSGDYGRVQAKEKLYTNINFGADNSGNLDNSYVGSYSGTIDGNSVVDSVTKNTLKMNLAGTLNMDNANINVYDINNTGNINVNQKVVLSTLNSSNSINGDGNINVASDGTLVFGKNTQNIANSVNLANNAELSTINQSKNSHTLKQLNKESDSKLSLDLGDAFNIQNTNSTGINLSQIKVDEETIKTLEDGKTYQVFENDSQIVDLTGSANVYYAGNKYGVSQDDTDAKYLKVNWLGYSSGLREAAQDATTANYINTELPQPYHGGTVIGNTFEVSGLDVDFDKQYEGLVIDGTTNAGGTTIKTGFYGGVGYNLKVQNGGILTVDSIDKDIKLGNTGEKALDINNGRINLNANNNKISVMGDIFGTDKTLDSINVSGTGDVNINAISNVNFSNSANNTVLNAQSKNVDWNLDAGMLSIVNDAYLSSDKTNSMYFKGGTLNVANNTASQINLDRMELNQTANVILDIDLASKKADTFVFDNASNLVVNDNKLVVSNANFVNPKTVLTDTNYQIPFVSNQYNNEALLGRVSSNVSGQVMTPIYKYGLGYTEKGNVGSFDLARSNTGTYKDYNPAILSSAVGAQVGGYLTQINSYDMAFGNMDMLMSMTKQDLNAFKYRNRYSANGTNLMTYNPNQLPEEYRGFWFKPYATYEKVNLKDGPKVENSIYSTYFGMDSELVKLKRGWYSMYSGYLGYNGSHQHFDGVSIYQNGGQIGATGMLFKDRFFAGITAGAGLGVGDASTMYGNEDFSLLTTGAAVKTGYNIGYKDDKVILQPSLLAGYSFINAYDYTNAAGVRIRPEDMHGLEIVPGLKLIGNLPNNWQPYASLQFVWNTLSDSSTVANGIPINQFKIKPYIQYGVGVQKRVGDNFTGYFQSMGRNFGRNGVSLSAGMRWAVGRNKG